jgi:hypothetical protein
VNLLDINFGIFTCPANSGFGPMTVAQWLNNPKIGGSNPAAGTVREKMAVKPFLFFRRTHSQRRQHQAAKKIQQFMRKSHLK